MFGVVLIYYGFSTLVSAVINPTIEIFPKKSPYILTVGSVLQPTCVYKSENSVLSEKLIFLKDGGPVGTNFSTIRQHNRNTVTMVITTENGGVQMSDSGVYSCNYNEWYNQIKVEVFSISYTKNVVLTGDFNRRNVYDTSFQNLTLECEPHFPKAFTLRNYSIEWYRHGALINPGSTVQTRYTTVNNRLTIVNADLRDIGEYQCSIAFENADQINQTVIIKASPKVISLQAARILELNEWKATCNISGYPYPDIHWFKDGKILQHQGRTHIANYIPGFSYLIITNVSKLDEGIYGCYVNTTSEYDWKVTRLVIYEPYNMIENLAVGLEQMDFVYYIWFLYILFFAL